MIFEREKEYIEKCIERKRRMKGQNNLFVKISDEFDSNNIVNESLEFDEGMNYDWTDIPSIYEEAINLLAMTRWSKPEYEVSRDRILEDVLEVGKEYKKNTSISSFFLNEICEYEQCLGEVNYIDEVSKYMENLLEEQVARFSKTEITRYGKSTYPIRIRIQRICEQVMLRVNGNTLGSTESYEWFNRVVELGQIVRRNEHDWFIRNDCVKEFLSLLLENNKGSLGHLLWICFYLAEIIYWKTDKSQDEYWKECDINIELVKKLYDTLESDVVKKRHELKNVMLENYNQQKLVGKIDSREENDRIRSILHRQPDVSLKLLDVENERSRRCYAVLTNGTHRIFAISGYDPDLYKHVLEIVCEEEDYEVVSDNVYDESQYIWRREGREGCIRKKELSLLPKSVNPKGYGRMFSCAERRLVGEYQRIGNNGEYIIISKWSPCYMCSDVLDVYKIPYDSILQIDDTTIRRKDEYDCVAEIVDLVKRGEKKGVDELVKLLLVGA